MNLERLQPRLAAGIGLLALLPVLWHAVGRSGTAGFVTVVHVLVISAALRVAMRPVDRGNVSPGTATATKRRHRP